MLKTAEKEPTVATPVRDFLRFLNITLKSVRMYGAEHTQTVSQTEQTWKKLQDALAGCNGDGLQLAVSEKRLLTGGVTTKNGPTEQSFAQLLDAADLASVTFLPSVKREALATFIQGFGETTRTMEGLGARLKQAIGDEEHAGLRINEVRFVPAGSEEASAEGALAAQLLAESFGGDATGDLRAALRDPVKLLDLIAAAEGASRGLISESKTPDPQTLCGTSSSEANGATEEDVTAAVRVLAKLSQDAEPTMTGGPASARQDLASLPRASQDVLRGMVAKFAESPSTRVQATPLLLSIAERMAIRLARERFERGDASVDAVAEMLGRLNREIEALRKVAGSYEKKLKDAGYGGEESAESLEDKFWTEASDESKRQLLLSSGAWRIPPRQARKYFDHLVEQNDGAALQEAILCYAGCIGDPSPEARRKTQVGLKQLAEYLPRVSGSVLQEVIRDLGRAIINEEAPELRNQIAATFVTLSLEAASRRRYGALLETLKAIEEMTAADSAYAEGLRGRIGIENRVPDFLEEAMRVPELPENLVDVLSKLPLASVQHIAGRMSRCVRRRERDRLVVLAKELGPPAVEALERFLQSNTPAAAVIVIGLLSHLRPEVLPGLLRPRLKEWSVHYHDGVVRQLGAAGAGSRGRILTQLLGALDASVVALAIDEIGMSGDAPMGTILMAIAGGEIPALTSPYLQVKACEALGRLKCAEAMPLLERMACDGSSDREMAIVACEAIERIEQATGEQVARAVGIRASESRKFLADNLADSPGVRNRLYKRVKLPRPASARLSSPDGEFSVQVQQLSLGGGTLTSTSPLPAGATGRLRLNWGSLAISAKVILRGPRGEHVAFEIFDIDLEERYKLRKFLAGVAK